jgi:ubiquinone/menaquinone biosynthesis C-methylase UbiE
MNRPHTPIPPVPDPDVPPETRGIVLTRAASVYDWLAPAMMFWQEHPLNNRAISFLKPEPHWSVLDVGCATGGMALALAKRLSANEGGLAIGLDASLEMVAVARQKIKQLPCRFDIGVAEKLPYPDASFDGLTSTFFFHHLNLEDKLTALREAKRVLKPGGRCVIVDVDVPTSLFGKIQAYSGYWLFKQPEIAENIDGKLVPLFTEAGFTDVKRCAHNLGYVTTFSMLKPCPKQGETP